MSSSPGRMQAAFTAGELDRSLYDRTTLKYFSTGAARVENVVIVPQGGFTLRDGLRHIDNVANDAARIMPFRASDGSSYEIVFKPGSLQVWNAAGPVLTRSIDINANQLKTMTSAQQLDTMIVFHKNLRPQRIRIFAEDDWQVDDAPLRNLPRYDYGESYSNGTPARWQLEFRGLEDGVSTFNITVSGHTTSSITFDADETAMAAEIKTKLLELPNIASGIDTTTVGEKVTIIFDGAGNTGDGWAVSATVINKADAAVLSSKNVIGIEPGEPVISASRGWPRCGVFYQQRLLIGGFKSLPNAWMASQTGKYFNFDMRFTEADGPFLVPMDVGGGEAIVTMFANLNLLIFTTEAEYWLAERALSKTEAPNHVQASRNGSKEGVGVVDNEGAALFCHENGNVLGELRYTDVDGNFIATDVSLLAPHLIRDIVDTATQNAKDSNAGNVLVTVSADGTARLATLLREQEVTAFGRMTTDGLVISATCNGSNQLAFITERNGSRKFERMEPGLLLDEAETRTITEATDTLTGFARFNGRDVWAIVDGDVFGPLTVADATLTLPIEAEEEVTVGTWRPPVVTTLPPNREVGPNVILRRRARIHTVHISLIDTTSVAISVNGGPAKDIDLHRYGLALADVPELEQGFTGVIKVTGLRGFADEPNVTITQVRPGRMTVRSLTIEAQL